VIELPLKHYTGVPLREQDATQSQNSHAYRYLHFRAVHGGP